MPLLLAAALAAATPTAAPDLGEALDICRRDFAVKVATGQSILPRLLEKVLPEHRAKIEFLCAVREDGALQVMQMLAAKGSKS